MFAEIAAAVGAAGLTAGGYAYAALWPASHIFGKTLIAGRDPREIALTFDDGPNDPYTLDLLDVLGRHQVHATFFMIGSFVRKRPDIVRAVRAAGHLIGNHTMTHPWLVLESPAEVRQQLTDCNFILEDVLGEPIDYFRPPHGARRPDVLRIAGKLGLTPVMWNVMGHDWEHGTTAARVRSHLQKGIQQNRRANRGTNIVLHDGGQKGIGRNRSATVEAVRSLVPEFFALGCQFVTVDDWNQPAI